MKLFPRNLTLIKRKILHQEISNALFSPNENELNMGKFSKM
jgi:hypothetical protein